MGEIVKKGDCEIWKVRIDRMPKTEKLYKLEAKRNEIVKECAREWSRLMGVPEKDFLNVAVPTALYDLLGTFGCGKPVAKVLLGQ